MRRTIILLYVMSLIRDGAATLSAWTGSSQLLPSHDVTQKPLNKVQDILKELMSGALLGRSVTLLLEEEEMTMTSLQSDWMVQDLGEPIQVLRLPQEMPEKVTAWNTTNGTHFSLDYATDYYPLTHSVLVIVFESNLSSWWPLWFPPSYWKLEALVLFISSTACSVEYYIETPLLAKPSSLAVFCLHEFQRPVQDLDFKVWTWRPFSSEGQLVDLGMWNGSLFQDWDHLFIDRFDDMRRKSMSILASGEDRPLIYVSPEGIPRGLNVIIMHMLSRWLKFGLTYETDPTLLWTTILDSITREENDIFINYATITADRIEDFDFTVPYHREGFAMILEVPPALPRWQSIVFPFTRWVWTAIAVSTLCSTVTYHLLSYKNQLSFINTGIIILQSLLSSPMETVPTIWRLRNFLLFWWIVSWFIDVSYTSNLIAVLTVPVFPRKIQTAEEVANSDYRLCMLDYGEFVDEALAEATHPVFSRLSKVLDMVPVIDDLEYTGEEQCIERVLAGTHAHVETYGYVEILYNKLGHGAKVYSLREQLYLGYLAFMVKKNTPWRYKFDTGIQWMFETGLIQKWYKDSMDDFKGYFEKKSLPVLVPLSLAHLQGPFLLYIISLLSAVVVLFWEIIFHPKKEWNSTMKIINYIRT